MKSYQQFCGVARALDILGERWTLLLVRDLLLGPRRFSDLQQSLLGITPNLLSKRLTWLTEQGVIARAGGDSRAYELTARGRSIEPVVLALGAFGAEQLTAPASGERLDPRWAMVSLKRRYRGTSSPGRLGIYFGESAFTVHIGGAALDVRDGAPDTADATLRGDFTGWFPLLTRRASLSEQLNTGLIERGGRATVATAFVRSIGARI